MLTLGQCVASCKTLDQVLQKVLDFLNQTSKTKPIAFVSGPITSNGPEKIELNKQKLFAIKQDLQQRHPEYFVFCDQDIFADIQKTIDTSGAIYSDYLLFYDAIFNSGHITHLFLCLGWENSTGAKREFELAQKLGIEITYL